MKTVPLREHNRYELPFGIYKDGKTYLDFAIRPLTGRVRQQVLQNSEKRNHIELIDNGVHAVLTSLCGQDAPPRGLVEKLVAVDRDYILLISQVNTKPMQDFKETCKGCGQVMEGEIDLEAVEILLPQDEDFYVLNGERVYDVTSPAKGLEKATMRMRTVKNEEEAFRGGRSKVPFGPEFKLLSDSIVDFNGNGPLTEQQVADLDVGVLDELNSLIGSKQFGPNLETLIGCEGCGVVNTHTLDVVTHFLGPSLMKALQTSGER